MSGVGDKRTRSGRGIRAPARLAYVPPARDDDDDDDSSDFEADADSSSEDGRVREDDYAASSSSSSDSDDEYEEEVVAEDADVLSNACIEVSSSSSADDADDDADDEDGEQDDDDDDASVSLDGDDEFDEQLPACAAISAFTTGANTSAIFEHVATTFADRFEFGTVYNPMRRVAEVAARANTWTLVKESARERMQCFLCRASRETSVRIECADRLIGRAGRVCAARFELASASCAFERALMKAWGKGAEGGAAARSGKANESLYAKYLVAERGRVAFLHMQEEMQAWQGEDDDSASE